VGKVRVRAARTTSAGNGAR